MTQTAARGRLRVRDAVGLAREIVLGHRAGLFLSCQVCLPHPQLEVTKVTKPLPPLDERRMWWSPEFFVANVRVEACR